MRNLSILTIFLLALLLSSCCGSRVVLLDNGKDGNAIVIATKAGNLILDEGNTYTDLSSTTPPKKPKKISLKKLEEDYGRLIAYAPQPPVTFQLYFKTGNIELTEESRQQLATLLVTVQERTPCDINIIGHTDSTGSKAYNVRLSLKRARYVEQWLSQQDLEISHIFVESYGEEDPLVPTADNVAEPRNRRVEVLIR